MTVPVEGDPTLEEKRPRAQAKGGRREPVLYVVLECARPLAAGARHLLGDVRAVVVGRGAGRRTVTREHDSGGATLVVRVPDRWMSSTHARIVRGERDDEGGDGEWVLEDAGSTNGSFVNGERVTRARLREADVIELGHTLILLHRQDDAPEDAPRDLDAEGDPLDVQEAATLVPALASQLAAVARVAATKTSVLLLGETGTGKEVMARTIHRLSGRRGDFVAVNCAALPPALLESQLFGHIKGAFSGATHEALGFVRQADGGTLFLDEIGDLPLHSQAALLRVLQEEEVIPVGATRPVGVDLRVVAATNQPLEARASRGEFRRDLYARLAGLRLTLPPLRDRLEDTGLLVTSALRAIAGDGASSITLTTAAGRALLEHDWPMNVRELRQALSIGVTLAPDGEIDVAHLPAPVGSFADSRGSERSAPRLSPEEEKLRAELLVHLSATRGNITEAARAMGRQRTQVHRWVKRLGIDLRTLRRS
jgi:DNA-binding NtrC family response regulator